MQTSHPMSALGRATLEHFAALVRFDTSNPPGNEREACLYIARILEREGVPFQTVEPSPGRINLVARLEGTKAKRPFLLNAHLDVVPAEREKWRHDPFGAVIEDGYLYGRGTLDMKQMAAMALGILVTLKREGTKPPRDLIAAFVADEEAGCGMGSAYLVARNPDWVDAEFGLTEGGGFVLPILGKTFVTVCVAEKGVLWVRLHAFGKPGHASVPTPESATLRLVQTLGSLLNLPLPLTLTPPMRAFFATLGKKGQSPWQARAFIRAMLRAKGLEHRLLPLTLKKGPDSHALGAMLRNTVALTRLEAGVKENVIPSSARADLDCRLLPGETSGQFLETLKASIPKEHKEHVRFEVLQDQGASASPAESPLYRAIGKTIEHYLPESGPIPFLTPGFTDAHHYRKLGMTMYGFIPMEASSGTEFVRLIHGHDERISLKNIDFGATVLMELTKRMLFEV